MKRWGFTFVAAVSLGGLVLTAAWWLYSYSSLNQWTYSVWAAEGEQPAARIASLGGADGAVWLSYERIDRITPKLRSLIMRTIPPGFHQQSMDLATVRAMGMFLDVKFEMGPTRRNGPGISNVTWTVRAPGWAATPPWAVLPAVWLYRRRKRRQREQLGHCRRCGYDLRESPARCPECGTAVPVAPAPVASRPAT